MNLKSLIKQKILLFDGATGTMLHRRSLALTERSETINISHPDAVYEIHKSYFDAGCNIVCANTFGALSLYYDDQQLESIISKALSLAQKAKADSNSSQEKFIALDLGPSGKLLKPYGDYDFDDAVECFAKSVRLGAKYGADLVFIETMNDSIETKAALLAAKENCNLPVFVCNAYGEDGKLLSGATPESLIPMLEGMGADAIGINCSFGPDKMSNIVDKYLKFSSLPIIQKPNAGLPTKKDGSTVFQMDSDTFCSLVSENIKKGVSVIGGCCGTTPEFIQRLRDLVDKIENPIINQEKNFTCVSSRSKAVFLTDDPILIGERINPTGKKLLKQALLDNNLNYLLNEAVKQQNAGAHILDVNVGLPQINEKKVLSEAIGMIQSVCDLPLQIDTSDEKALESAIRNYDGCPLINSINGKKSSLEAVLPIAKKYGGVIVALTLDENGIPETVDGRLEIANRILLAAENYGIDRKRLVFDTLTMSISTDINAAKITLESLNRIRTTLGCHTVLGVSNVSFGIPQRDIINSAFFTLALESGLSAAIMNPLSAEMMKSYHAYRAVKGFDKDFSSYISFASTVTNETQIAVPKKPEQEVISTLKDAVIRGSRELATNMACELLTENTPLWIIENHLMPALDTVGAEYGSGKMFLPQLLLSAQAAQCAFDVIREKATDTNAEKRELFVIATVEGDVHDIGKNIVKLLLQNYGFEVVDLGKNVPARAIVDKVVELHAPFMGLSALMTTTLPFMENTVKLARKEAPWCKILVGGAVLTKEYAEKIGADFYAKDAIEAVRYAENSATH